MERQRQRETEERNTHGGGVGVGEPERVPWVLLVECLPTLNRAPSTAYIKWCSIPGIPAFVRWRYEDLKNKVIFSYILP